MNIELCKTIDSPDGFVGVKMENNLTKVYFPYGYPVEETKKLCEYEIKKQIRYLIYTISSTKTNMNLNTQLMLTDDYNYLYDCMYLIEEYFKSNLYKEKKCILSNNSNGKINWKKTINSQLPLISYNKSNLTGVYFQNIYRNKFVYSNNIITQLHIEALNIAKENIGFLYNDFELPKSNLQSPIKYIPHLINQMKKTFKDTDKVLLDAIRNVIINRGKEINPISFKLGTTSYNIVWEQMLKKVYGNLDETKFFPRLIYKLKSKGTNKLNRSIVSTMRPDLLFKPTEKQEYYVIDAKYYKFFEKNNDINSLPASESISKQIIYQKKIEEKLIHDKIFSKKYVEERNPVRSMFILPYNKNKYDEEEYIASSIKELAFKGFGTIESVENSDKRYTISLAFKDTKELITEYNEGRKYHYISQYHKIISAYEDYLNKLNEY